MKTRKTICIVGGVAGGASAAARLRRLDEHAEIILFERGPHVSFANCGLPYFIGGEITDEEDLLVATPESLHARFRLEVRVLHEVIRIDRETQTLEVRDLQAGAIQAQHYDVLVLAPGAAPVRPPIPGIDRPGLFTLRNVPDTLAISSWINEQQPRTAVVVGAGFIGLEMVEQLVRRGLTVTVVEALDQVLNVLDPEIAGAISRELRSQGVELQLSDAVAAFEAPEASETALASTVVLKSGRRLPADLIILGIGVRPENKLAREAGLEIGALGGIRVNPHMQTSDPAIYAVGDAVECRHPVTGEWKLIPLAGPANRQGRVAAGHICGRPVSYAGTWGTGILRVFDITAGGTGATEKMLRACRMPYEVVHLHSPSHASYYPGAQFLSLKILFSPSDGRLLGAQVVGGDGVDKRMDVLATAVQAHLTVHDLAELELAYAPPFASAKDPVNLAGMAAQNLLNGDYRQIQWYELADHPDALVLDVRQPEETEAQGELPGSINIPLPELRARMDSLPCNREILIYCKSGQRAYVASRMLQQHGFNCLTLSGSWMTYRAATS